MFKGSVKEKEPERGKKTMKNTSERWKGNNEEIVLKNNT